MTNVVKHFKFEERGRRRIHQTPKRFEIEACRPWLDAELDVVRPEALVLLGAVAAKALLGSSFRVTQHRGELLDTTWLRSSRHHPPVRDPAAPDDCALPSGERSRRELTAVASALERA